VALCAHGRGEFSCKGAAVKPSDAIDVGEKINAAVLVAAGMGTRMDPDRRKAVPKVLYSLGTTTVLERCLEAFEQTGLFSRIVVVVHPSFLEAFEEFDFSSRVSLVAGGETRSDSVRCGLGALGNINPNSIVAVHDAARPFISPSVIIRCVEACQRFSAVTAAVRVVDSLCMGGKDRQIEREVERDGVWQVQTPQVFTLELLEKAHCDCRVTGTDDASLVRSFHPVHLVEGDRVNFKLTTPDDYSLAQRLVG
jgi:2-C-methyl-D-erythritol 4-phosphate cytidylyltransferase